MDQLSSELLKIKKHARLVAETAMYTAISNRETSVGGWLSACNVKMGEAAENATSIEQELEERERKRK